MSGRRVLQHLGSQFGLGVRQWLVCQPDWIVCMRCMCGWLVLCGLRIDCGHALQSRLFCADSGSRNVPRLPTWVVLRRLRPDGRDALQPWFLCTFHGIVELFKVPRGGRVQFDRVELFLSECLPNRIVRRRIHVQCMSAWLCVFAIRRRRVHLGVQPICCVSNQLVLFQHGHRGVCQFRVCRHHVLPVE